MRACQKLGEVYHCNGQTDKMAISYVEKGITIARDLQEKDEEEKGYRVLEYFYRRVVQKHEKSVECRQIASVLVQIIKSDQSLPKPFPKFHQRTGNEEGENSLQQWSIEKACHYFCRSILVQDEARRLAVHDDEINTSISNMFFHRNTCLMNSLLDLNQVKTALLVWDIGKAKALRNLMNKGGKMLAVAVEEKSISWINAISHHPSSYRNNKLLYEASCNVLCSIQDGTILVYGVDSLDVLHIWVVSAKGVFHKRYEAPGSLSTTHYLEAFVNELRHRRGAEVSDTHHSTANSKQRENYTELHCFMDCPANEGDKRSFKADFAKRVKRLRSSTNNKESSDLFKKSVNLQRLQSLYCLDTTVAVDQQNISSSRREIEYICAKYGLDSSSTEFCKSTDHPKVDIKEYTNFHSYFSTLYSFLIASVKEFFTGNKLVIVPHGPLFTLPFAALMDSNKVHLCEQYSIQITPALHTLELSLARPPRVLGHALFVGNPTVGTIMFEGKTGSPGHLPNAEIEAQTCGRHFGSKALTGKQATKENVLRNLKNASIVHIAAHGHEKYASIFLAPNAGSPSPPSVEHYLLLPEDVTKCTLNARLVVLSCCFSGRGQISSEGVVGIARSFLGAGARSVLTTLWMISDEATLEIMEMFYDNVCQGYSVCVALQRTMKTLKKKYPVEDWAAFEILGEDIAFSKEDIDEICRQSSKGTDQE